MLLNLSNSQIKEIKEDTRYGETFFHAPGLVESTLWKWLYYWKQSSYSVKSPWKFYWYSSQNKKKFNPKVHMKDKSKRPQITKAVLSRKNTAGGAILRKFKLYHRAIVTQRVWQRRPVDQWNRLEDPEIKTHSCKHLIFDQVSKAFPGGKKTVFKK